MHASSEMAKVLTGKGPLEARDTPSGGTHSLDPRPCHRLGAPCTRKKIVQDLGLNRLIAATNTQRKFGPPYPPPHLATHHPKKWYLGTGGGGG